VERCPFCADFEDDLVVYADGRCYAVVDLHPINHHHLVLAPREHHRHFVDLPDELVAHLFVVAKRLSQALRDAVGVEAIHHISDDDLTGEYNLFEHYKLHLIPRFANDGVSMLWAREDATRAQRVAYAADVKARLHCPL